MRIDPTTRKGRLLLAIGAFLLRQIIRLLGSTCRLRIASGEEHLAVLDDGAAVLSYWHQRTILAAPFFLRRLLGRDRRDLTLLVSQSRDGELVSRVASRWRFRLVRGSASRGGMQAMRSLYRSMRTTGTSPLMIPDGPRGPAQSFKPGVAVLAQMAQAPILPMAFATRRGWRLRSWDRLIVPKPFAEIVVVVGPPQPVARGLDSAALEMERARLETLLDTVTDEADRHAIGR